MSNSQPSASAKALPLAGPPPDSQNGPQPAALSDDLKRALAALDMPAIVALAEEQAWLAVSITGDPEALLRSYRSRNKRITGIALTLRCANEVAGGRVVARALDLIERQGTRRDGRYVAVTADVLEARLRESAGVLCMLMF